MMRTHSDVQVPEFLQAMYALWASKVRSAEDATGNHPEFINNVPIAPRVSIRGIYRGQPFF
jgi:hypothetical protein